MKDKIEVSSLTEGLEVFLNKTKMQCEIPYFRCGALVTGFPDLDKKIGGLGKGLNVIAGRPLNYHEMFHRNIIENMLMELDDSNSILHLESGIDVDSFYRRMVSSFSRVDYMKLDKGQLDDDSWARISATLELFKKRKNLFVRHKSTYVEDIPKLIQQLDSEDKKVSVLSISSIHNLKTKKPYESRYAEVSNISKTLKAISIDYDLCLIVGSNVNRRCEERVDKQPLIRDLRDSGTLEDDANTILFCYNPDVYSEDNLDITEIAIAKNDFGSLGSIRLLCSQQYSRFDNCVGYEE